MELDYYNFTIMDWFWYFYNFFLCFYIPEYGHMDGRSMYDFIVCINLIQYTYLRLLVPLLGVFTKLRKASISFLMSVSPSFRPFHMEQLGSHWTDFNEIWYLIVFRKKTL